MMGGKCRRCKGDKKIEIAVKDGKGKVLETRSVPCPICQGKGEGLATK